MNKIIKSVELNKKILIKKEEYKENQKNTEKYINGKLDFEELIKLYSIKPFNGLSHLKPKLHKYLVNEESFKNFIKLENFLRNKDDNYIKILEIESYKIYLDQLLIQKENKKQKRKIKSKKYSGKNGGFKVAIKNTSPNNKIKFFR